MPKRYITERSGKMDERLKLHFSLLYIRHSYMRNLTRKGEKMREILFKAKRIENGEWVEGYYCKYGYTGKEKHYIIPDYASDLYAFKIDIDTLCQYTGLTDKNGNNIWENDVVRYCDDLANMNKEDLVKWNETHASFVRLHKSKMGLQYLYIDEYIANRCEVIGNIFDDPELLEE